MVYIENDSFQIAGSGSGDYYTFSTCGDVRFCLIRICEETGTFQNYIYIMLTPWNLSRIFLSIYLYFVSVNADCVFRMIYFLSKTALCSIILQKMCKHLRFCKIVDRNYFNSFHIVDLTEGKAANTPKTINGNFNFTHFCGLDFCCVKKIDAKVLASK